MDKRIIALIQKIDDLKKCVRFPRDQAGAIKALCQRHPGCGEPVDAAIIEYERELSEDLLRSIDAEAMTGRMRVALSDLAEAISQPFWSHRAVRDMARTYVYLENTGLLIRGEASNGKKLHRPHRSKPHR